MRKTLTVISLIAIILSIGLGLNYLKSTHSYATNIPISIKTHEQQVIEKDVVIEKLKQTSEVVGLEGEFHKEYSFTEKTFESGINFLENAGKRSYKINLNGTFKMGFDLAEIEEDHIFIDGTTVKIITPKVKLISFEAPFHMAKIDKKKGFLAKDFTEEDRKLIYEKAYNKALKEITYHEDTNEKATIFTQAVLKKFLLKVDLVENIEFIDVK